jgi:hypothetical protein
MIGSLMSRMGMAEKLSVAQLQKAVQDGTLPAYVGVPLIQDKLKQEKLAKAAAAGTQQQQPPIAQQVMQEASQRGIDEAQSNLPEVSMAGGGIVAFASGDLVDDETDDDEDSLEERQLAAETQSLFNQAAGRVHEGMESSHGIGSISPKESRETAYSINPESKGISGIKDPFLSKIERLESGGKEYDKHGNILTSSKGAKGSMQVMDKTNSDPGFGVTPARNDSPEERARVGRDYALALKKHYKGDEKLASMAYNWGPGNVDKWLASEQKMNVPSETRQYAANFAQGGIASIKHYATGDVVSGGYNPYALEGDIGASAEDYDKTDYGIGKAIRNELMGVKTQEEVNKQRFKTAPSKTPMGPTNEELKRPTAESKALEDVNKELTPKEEPKGIDSAITKEPTIEQKYMDLLKGRESGVAKQRSIDNYMSLLQAGLGMMGGTSPHAMVNIGQGASTGIAAKMAAEKNRIAEEAATMKGYGSLYNIQQNAEMRKTLAGQSQDAAMRKQQFATLGNLEQRTRASIAASLDKSMNTMGMSDEEKARKVDQLTAQALAQSQAYKSAYKAYNGYDFAAPSPINTISGSDIYAKHTGLVPKPQQ